MKHIQQSKVYFKKQPLNWIKYIKDQISRHINILKKKWIPILLQNWCCQDKRHFEVTQNFQENKFEVKVHTWTLFFVNNRNVNTWHILLHRTVDYIASFLIITKTMHLKTGVNDVKLFAFWKIYDWHLNTKRQHRVWRAITKV